MFRRLSRRRSSLSPSNKLDKKSLSDEKSEDITEDIEDIEDDDDDDDPRTSGNERKSWGLGAKKYMATRTANSKVGRKVIGHFLGEEGNRLMYGLKLAMKQDVGKAKAKEYRNLIFKFALKGKLLSDSAAVKKKDVWRMIEPLNNLGVKCYGLLKPVGNVQINDMEEQEQQEEKSNKVDVSTARNEMEQVEKMTFELMAPHMRPKNCAALEELFAYVGSEDFLDKVINDPDYREAKSICFNSMRTLLLPLLETRTYDENMEQVCEVKDCEAYSMLACGDFNGSPFCAKHHEEFYMDFIKCPTVEHFLSGPGHAYFPFQVLAKKHIDRFSRKLMLACRKYREVVEGSRKILADMIWKKYLARGSSHIVTMPGDDKWPALRKAVEEGLNSKDGDLFLAMETHLYGKFVNFFNDFYLTSDEYQTYINVTFKLPEFFKDNFEDKDKD